MALLRRDARSNEPADIFSRFDRMFDEWMRSLPFRGFESWPGSGGEDVIRVDEFRGGNTLVVQAELPGVDPDKDVDLSVSDGMLNISAQRRTEEEKESKGHLRRELRYGSFVRSLPLPEGATDSDISATYRDGMLEIRVQMPEIVEGEQPKKISIEKG